MTAASLSICPLFARLLVNAGIVEEGDLEHCLDAEFDENLPPGSVLVSKGHITARLLEQTREVARLVRNRAIELELGARVLADSKAYDCNLVAALKRCGWLQPRVSSPGKPAQMLMEAGVLTPEQIEQAAVTAACQGLPLGAALVKSKLLTATNLWATLTAVMLSDRRQFARQEIIEHLKTALKRGFRLELVLPEESGDKRAASGIRFGELLSTSGIVDEFDVLAALEGSLETGVPIGQLLVSRGTLTNENIERLLEIQSLAASLEITPLQASGVAKQVITRGIPVSEAIKQVRDTAEYVKKSQQMRKPSTGDGLP